MPLSTILNKFCLLSLILAPAATFAQWTRECSWDVQCEEKYMPGSKCLEGGVCSNPFMEGCLNNFYSHQQTEVEATPPMRTCNSDDTSTSRCEPSPMNYHEVRVHNANWESAIMYSMIIQVFLSEFLHVPATVGMGADRLQASFYAPDMPMSWSSKAYAWDEIVAANAMGGECRGTDRDCVHVLPEVWIGQEKKWRSFLSEGHIDQVNGDGQVGKISWYIPVLTAQRHPHVASYHGMAGNREELAAIFNRPTTWGDYCEFHSPTNCTEDDGVAASAPSDENEDAKYFQDGLYTGYFHATEKNDCIANPDTCSGHIVGAPCSWSTNVEAQAHWNDISLESDGPLPENNGYSYGQMIDIWRAANATQSDIVMWWWTPDATVEEFRDTPYQFQPVLLPEPTAECRAARIEPEDRCSFDQAVRRGSEGGGCDNEANSLQKVVASSLRDLTFDTPEVDRSPGYQAILNLKVSHLDMNMMLQKWVNRGRSGYAARQAVCEWVVEHQDELESFIPRGFPRVFAENTSYSDPLLYGALGVAGFAVAFVLVATYMVYKYSEAKVFVYAQVTFVYLVLFGLFLVAMASIFFALEPQDPICVSQTWFMTLGYTFELVPLLVKVAAINRVVQASKRMKRVRISVRSLFLTVAGIVIVVTIFLIAWTVVDTPARHEGRYLQEENSPEIVTNIVCASQSAIWDLVVLCWNGLLVVCATVLAFQSRNVQQEFNDSKSLGTMIYSHFVFAVLRAITLNIGGSQTSNEEGTPSTPPINPSMLAAAASFLMSLDVITAIGIYVIPKLAAARRSPHAHTESSEINSSQMENGSMFYSKTAVKSTHQTSGQRSMGSSGQQSGSRKRFASSMPSIDEAAFEDSDRTDPQESAPPTRKRSLQPSQETTDYSNPLRVGMDGNIVHTDDEQESSSTDDEDGGGPRFSSSGGARSQS